jgi:hypothetical protein
MSTAHNGLAPQPVRFNPLAHARGSVAQRAAIINTGTTDFFKLSRGDAIRGGSAITVY